MILKGPNIEHQIQLVNTADTSALNTISQLLMFNSVLKAQVANPSSSLSHKHHYEMLYILMNCNTKHKIEILLIPAFFGIMFPMTAFWDWHLTYVSNRICEQFKLRPKLVLYSSSWQHRLYNPSSATAKALFHGTDISLIQHPSHECIGYGCDLLVINKTPIATSSCSTATLPVNYMNALLASTYPV